MRPIPINAAEAVIEAFWTGNGDLSESEEWIFKPGEGTYAKQGLNRMGQHQIRWDMSEAREIIASLERKNIDVYLNDYDTMIILLCLKDTAVFNLWAYVDGEERCVVMQERGRNNYEEYEGEIRGKRLTGLRLEFIAKEGGEGEAGVFWIGLAEKSLRERLGKRSSPYTPEWPGMLVEDKISEPNPGIGLFFDNEELKSIRKKANSKEYVKLMNMLRKTAKGYLGLTPEKDIGDYFKEIVYAYYSRPWDRAQNLYIPAKICSFVGLVDKDDELLRFGARCALSLAHTTHWVPSFHYRMPGSPWANMAFYESYIAESVAIALDFAWDILTPRAREYMRYCISMKGYPAIEKCFWSSRHMRNMNQGILFSYYKILCMASCGSQWPYSMESLSLVEEILNKNIDEYILEDGGSWEGIIYWSATLAEALRSYLIISRHKKIEMSEVIPEKVRMTAEYVYTMLSTAGNPGEIVPIGDAFKFNVYMHTIALMSKADPDNGKWAALLAALLEVDPEQYYERNIWTEYLLAGSIFALIAGKDKLPFPELIIPEFKILKSTGILTSCRMDKKGSIRINITGGKAGAGHAHEERGSFILEAYGDVLLIDRGQIIYSDSRMNEMYYATNHNLLTPDTKDGSKPRQICPCEKASIPWGKGDNIKLSAGIDLTAPWEHLVEKYIRKFESNSPSEINIVDEIIYEDERGATFNLHSRWPIKKSVNGWVIKSEHAVLRIVPLWERDWESADINGIDRTYNPVWHLQMHVAKGKKHTLVTRLEIEGV